MAAPLVLGLVPDLLFATRIEQGLRHLGYRVDLAADATALVARTREAEPELVLVDLAARGVDVPAAIRALRADPATRAVPIVAFGPHLDEAARAAARDAGADAVVANSKLALDLPGVLARYARANDARADDA
jgi:CheY-like chemotaxis protein